VNILITGGRGFLGGWLCKELRAHGHEVHVADWKMGTHVNYEWDLRKPGVFLRQLDHHEPEVVVHMAAQVGRLFGEDDLINTISENAQMTTLIARACGDAGVRLVYTSTSEIYGDNGDQTCEERDGPFSLPHNLYGLTKRWGEEVCELYCPDDLVILRPSMPYGPGVPPGRGRAALPNVIWQTITGQRIPIHRGAERSWCWVGDTVYGMRLAIEQPDAGIFNIGRDDNPLSMHDLALLAVRMFDGSAEQIDLIDPPAAQTVVKRLSTDALRRLGWRPEVGIQDGMVSVFEWVRNFDADGRRRTFAA